MEPHKGLQLNWQVPLGLDAVDRGCGTLNTSFRWWTIWLKLVSPHQSVWHAQIICAIVDIWADFWISGSWPILKSNIQAQNGATEKAGVESVIRAKLQVWKMQDWKMREQIAGVENAGVSRMECQPEIILRQLKLLRYTCPYSCD